MRDRSSGSVQWTRALAGNRGGEGRAGGAGPPEAWRVEVGCLRLHRVTSVRPAWHRRSRERTHVLTSCRSKPPKKSSLGPPLARPNLAVRISLSLSLSRLLLPRRGESRDVEPAFQKSTLMMLISRGGPGLLRVTRDLAEPFAMPAIARSPRGTFDPMIYGLKGLKRLTVRCSPLLRFFFNHPFPPRFLFARIN